MENLLAPLPKRHCRAEAYSMFKNAIRALLCAGKDLGRMSAVHFRAWVFTPELFVPPRVKLVTPFPKISADLMFEPLNYLEALWRANSIPRSPSLSSVNPVTWDF
jgi:hypothetical protein